MELNLINYSNIISRALAEDLGNGDVTTSAIDVKKSNTSGRMIAKQDGIIAGLFVAAEVFRQVDPSIKFIPIVEDGEKVKKGDIIANIKGDADSILKGERTALNFLQRMSGIATKTARCVELIKGTKARVVDTRKTAPGLRILDKYAVRTGGGHNHRFSLSDGILLKDNHIAAAGGIKNAISRAKDNAPHTLKIEVEVESKEQLKEAIEAGADIVMLDNMSPDLMRECVEIASGRVILEASGNVDESNIAEIARAGVDIISLGSLTHSVKAFDISLRFSGM